MKCNTGKCRVLCFGAFIQDAPPSILWVQTARTLCPTVWLGLTGECHGAAVALGTALALFPPAVIARRCVMP